MKRLVAIIFIVVVLLIVGAAPVLANGNGKGPPEEILNYTWTPGEVIESQSPDNAPPEDIQIWLPDLDPITYRNPKGQCIHIVPRLQPAG